MSSSCVWISYKRPLEMYLSTLEGWKSLDFGKAALELNLS
jgi:hypothetical protein